MNTTIALSSDRKLITIAVLGSFLGVTSIAVVLAVMIYVGAGPAPATGLKTDQERQDLLTARQAEDIAALTSPAWVNRPQTIVRIPIETAMRKLIAEATTRPTKP